MSAEPGRRPGSVACPRPKCGLRFVSRDVDTLDVCVRGSGGSSRVAWYRRECPVTCDALFLICVVTGSCRAVGVDALVARSSIEARTPLPPRARTGAGGAAAALGAGRRHGSRMPRAGAPGGPVLGPIAHWSPAPGPPGPRAPRAASAGGPPAPTRSRYAVRATPRYRRAVAGAVIRLSG